MESTHTVTTATTFRGVLKQRKTRNKLVVVVVVVEMLGKCPSIGLNMFFGGADSRFDAVEQRG